MSKGSKKIPEPVNQLAQSGLNTSAFSLNRGPNQTVTRQVPNPAFRTNNGQGGDLSESDRFPRFAAGSSPTIERTEEVPGSGAFQLNRTDNVVPEGELGLLAQTRQLFPRIGQSAETFGGRFAQSRERLEGLLARVSPGFGDVTRGRVAAIDRNRAQTIGNLRTAFGKRNVLGASFAQGDIRAADQGFAQLEAEARAESAIQEIQLSEEIIGNIANLDAGQMGLLNENFRTQLLATQQEQSVLAQRATRELEELRIAGNLITGNQQVAASLAVAQAQLSAAQAASTGQLIGTAVGVAAALAISDRRMKTNIRSVGMTDSGQPIYTFRYKGFRRTYMGVMTDESPSNAVVNIGGVEFVDYERIK